MAFSDFLKEIEGNRAEGEIVKSMLYGLVAASLTFAILYFLRFRYIESFMPKYGLYIGLICLSYVLLLPMTRHVRAYGDFQCMTGMMIGMTSGMVSSFLVGFYIGATNGLFIGGLSGMIVGGALGIYLGRCCGIMGIMEGIMAAFMGGWMGAMTSVMLLNDHIKAASVIVLIVNAIIALLLHYMIYNEKREFQREGTEDYSVQLFVIVILIALSSWIMVYGPRSFLFG